MQYTIRGTVMQSVEVTLEEDPAIEVVTYEDAGLEVTSAIRNFRSEWLDSRGAS